MSTPPPPPPPSSKCQPDETHQRIRFVITGSGKRPEDWITLVSCIRYCELHTLADTIEAQYQEGDRTGESELLLYPGSAMWNLTLVNRFETD